MSAATAPAETPLKSKPSRKNFWMRQLYGWHWMSSAISLVCMLLFAITGFTLNHAGDIEAKPRMIERAAQLPLSLRRYVAPDDAPDGRKPLPDPVATYVTDHLRLDARGDAEWSADEIYLARPAPGSDTWIAIDRASGAVTSEATNRGWLAYLNDLHKGRNAGTAWKWFIDLFAIACLVFALTGLVLLLFHARSRRLTWPLVGLGLLIPAGIAIFLIH